MLLILASVSITVVFGDNGILQLAKEAGEKTNEAVQGDKENIGNATNYIKSLSWDASKVTAVTTKDGGIVPVPKGFVGSELDGENTIKDGFVIYEIPEEENLDWKKDIDEDGILDIQQDCNQFVWVPADGVSLEYKQDKETWKENENLYNDYTDWWDEEEITFRKESVEKYGGFYVGRYEAGINKDYKNGDTYERNSQNASAADKKPVTKRGKQAWNFVSQEKAKELSENMYTNNASVASRLIDSYAWDTICTWLSNSKINVMDSTSWGNYSNSSYTIKGLYARHTWNNKWVYATKYGNDETNENDTFLIPENKNNVYYEVATGISVVDENGEKIDRNKAKNIYDFAGNMWEWTTEIREYKDKSNEVTQPKATYCVTRGGGMGSMAHSASYRDGENLVSYVECDLAFRTVLYIN